jgi:hypothetical protein
MSASKGSEANTKAGLLSASFEYFRAGGDYRHRLLQKLKSEIPKHHPRIITTAAQRGQAVLETTDTIGRLSEGPSVPNAQI